VTGNPFRPRSILLALSDGARDVAPEDARHIQRAVSAGLVAYVAKGRPALTPAGRAMVRAFKAERRSMRNAQG
jgi:hypothetical protein